MRTFFCLSLVAYVKPINLFLRMLYFCEFTEFCAVFLQDLVYLKLFFSQANSQPTFFITYVLCNESATVPACCPCRCLRCTTTSPPPCTSWTRSTPPWTSRMSPLWPTTSRCFFFLHSPIFYFLCDAVVCYGALFALQV